MTIQAQRELDDAELEELARQMESWSAEQVVEWAIQTFGSRLSIAASMADTVLVHMATNIDPDVEVVFLDTGFHFSETLVTLRRAQSKYRLNLRVERAAPDAPDLFEV